MIKILFIVIKFLIGVVFVKIREWCVILLMLYNLFDDI